MTEYGNVAYSHEHEDRYYATLEEALASAIRLRQWPEDLGADAVFTVGSLFAEQLDPVELIRKLGADATVAPVELVVLDRDAEELVAGIERAVLTEDWGGYAMNTAEWSALTSEIARIIDGWLEQRGLFAKMLSTSGGSGVLHDAAEMLEYGEAALSQGLISKEDLEWLEAEALRREEDEDDE